MAVSGLTAIGYCEPIVGRSILAPPSISPGIVIVPFDPVKGTIQLDLARVIPGILLYPSWSPKGQFLSYYVVPHPSDLLSLWMRNIKSGEEHKLAEGLLPFGSSCWSPDGKHILARGIKQGKLNLLRVNVDDGEVSIVIRGYPPMGASWSLDGRALFYVTSNHKLVKRFLKSTEELQLGDYPGEAIMFMELSPDENRVALVLRPLEGLQSRLLTLPASGGQGRELFAQATRYPISFPTWSRDGTSILFVTRVNEMSEIRRISVEGGEPEPVWRSEAYIYGISVHPDGNSLAFSLQRSP